MMRRASSARRAERFAAALDGRSVDGLDDDTRAFLSIVDQLRDIDRPVMRPEFASSLRDRLMAEAPVALADLPPLPAARAATPSNQSPEPRRRRVVRIAAVTCLVFGTVGGVAAASQSALPGDPLYGLKRSIERVQVSLAGSDADRGDALLDQADTRLSEVEALAIGRPDDNSSATLMSDTLDVFNDQARDGADSLVDAYNEDADGSDIVRVRDFADDSVDRLLDLADVVPAPVRDDLVAAAAVLSDIDASALESCADCSPLGPLELSASMKELQAVTENTLDGLLPGDDGTPGDQGPGTGGGPTLPGDLPTVPEQTGPQGGDGTNGGDDPGGGGPGTQPGQTQPTIPLPSGGGGLPTVPLPSVPLPSLPLPSVPLPSLPLPSLPLPTILELPEL